MIKLTQNSKIGITIRPVFLATIFIFLIGTMSAQTNKSQIYQAYIKGDMLAWKSIIDNMQAQEPKSIELRLELANYHYGYIGWCIGSKNYDLAKKYLEKAEQNLSEIEKSGKYASNVCSYKAAFVGFQIGINTYKAPILGPKSVECAEKAILLDKTNPFGFMEYGNIEYYMPAMFGGSKSKAITYYLAALTLLERKPEYLKNDWNYLNFISILANAYTEVGNYDKAELYYKKVMTIEPEFSWVKNTLYPKFLKKSGRK